MAKVVLKLGRDISTDDIYPGRFMATVLPIETPQYCFSDRTEFNARLRAREIPAGSSAICCGPTSSNRNRRRKRDAPLQQ
jgi:3-isopropylmalate dehydratase small subunit